MVAAILAAAGLGLRLGGGIAKGMRELAGRPLYAYSLDPLCTLPELVGVWLVVPEANVSNVARAVESVPSLAKKVRVLAGGRERQDSVALALRQVPQVVTHVLVHDAARPFASAALFRACVAAARSHGAAIAAVPATDTVKWVEDRVVVRTLDRARTWFAQTPQVARADWLRESIARAEALQCSFTDEAALLEHFGYPVHVVRGEEWNRKLTTPEDWAWAEWAVTQAQPYQ